MRFSLGFLFCVLLFLSVALRPGEIAGVDSDYALHVLYGREILRTGTPYIVDPTIYTIQNSQPILHEWGAETVFAFLDNLFGIRGPVICVALVVATVTYLVYSVNLRYGGWSALLSLPLAVLGLATSFTVRPHVFSVLGFVLLYCLIRDWEAGGRKVFWLPVLVAVWTNLHGGVLYVIPMLGVAMLTSIWRGRQNWWHMPLLMGVSVLAMLVNPWGWGLWLHVIDFLGHGCKTLAPDFGPPTWGQVILFFIPALMLAGLRPFADHRRDPFPLLMLLWTGVVSAQSMRGLPFFAITMAFSVGPSIHSRLPHWLQVRSKALKTEEESAGGDWIPLLMAWVLVCVSLALPAELRGDYVPTAAVRWINQNPRLTRERGFAGFNSSGYVLYMTRVKSLTHHALNANYPWELMEEGRVMDNAQPGWRELFMTHDISWALVQRGTRLEHELASSGWEARWFDGRFIILSRDPSLATR